MEAEYIAAIRYVEKYGWSIVPLKYRSKAPAVYWAPFQNRRATPEELETWFADTQYGIGVVCGAISDIVVLDDDIYYHTDEDPDLSDVITPTVRTGNPLQSYHRYFFYPQGGLGRQDYSSGMKLRGDGHYVVAPPSEHPSGGTYCWTRELETTPLAEVPEALTRPRFDWKQFERQGPPPMPAVVPAGGRHDALISLAGRLRRSVSNWQLLAQMLDVYNQAACQPPLDYVEIELMAQKVAQRYGLAAPIAVETDLSPLEIARMEDEEQRSKRLAEHILRGD